MKKLYEFVEYKEEEKEEKVVTKNENNEEVTTIKKIKEKVAYKFFLRKPNREMFDEAELFYGINLSESIKKGLLTRAQLATKFADEGKTFSEKERRQYISDNMEVFELDKQYRQIMDIKEEERSAEQKEKVKKLQENIIRLRDEIQQFELAQNSLFDYTAETRARNKTVLWWVFSLCYRELNGDIKPIFTDETYEEKLKQYDKIEEDDDEFLLKVIRRCLFAVNLWYMGRAANQAEFDELMKQLGFEPEETSEQKEEKLVEQPKKKD